MVGLRDAAAPAPGVESSLSSHPLSDEIPPTYATSIEELLPVNERTGLPPVLGVVPLTLRRRRRSSVDSSCFDAFDAGNYDM